MTGNTTVYTSNRRFFPAIWEAKNIAASTSEKIGVAGLAAGLNELPFPRRGSIVSVVLALSAPLTAGQIVARITKDGVNTGDTLTINDTVTTRRIIDLEPGALTFNRNHELGVRLSTSAAFAPSTTDCCVYFEVQDEA